MANTSRRNSASNESPDVAADDAAKAWVIHEHVADTVSNEAQKLVNMAGSVELAKEALNSTVEPLSTAQKEELARQFGHESFDKLLEASTVLTLTDGSVWCLTADRSGRWAAWNVYAIDMPRRFKSKEEALSVIQDSSG